MEDTSELLVPSSSSSLALSGVGRRIIRPLVLSDSETRDDMDVSMWTIRLTPDVNDPASEWREVGADEETTAMPSRLPLQLQSDTHRKLELRERDMGDVCVPASKVGVSGLSSATSASSFASGNAVETEDSIAAGSCWRSLTKRMLLDGSTWTRSRCSSLDEEEASSVVLLVRMLSSTL